MDFDRQIDKCRWSDVCLRDMRWYALSGSKLYALNEYGEQVESWHGGQAGDGNDVGGQASTEMMHVLYNATIVAKVYR